MATEVHGRHLSDDELIKLIEAEFSSSAGIRTIHKLDGYGTYSSWFEHDLTTNWEIESIILYNIG